MRSLRVAIHSATRETRILATTGPMEPLLKARLSATTRHPRALLTLLEALALWAGTAVRAAVVVDDLDFSCVSCVTRLSLDALADGGHGGRLYAVEFVRPPRDRLAGVGDFRDLHQLLSGVAE